MQVQGPPGVSRSAGYTGTGRGRGRRAAAAAELQIVITKRAPKSKVGAACAGL